MPETTATVYVRVVRPAVFEFPVAVRLPADDAADSGALARAVHALDWDEHCAPDRLREHRTPTDVEIVGIGAAVTAGTPHPVFGRVVRLPGTPPPEDTRDAAFRAGLIDFLLTFAPLAIAEQRGRTNEELEPLRERWEELVTYRGDELQYGGPHRGASRSALAQGIALLARAEGGVTALGIHACITAHAGCPGAAPPPAVPAAPEASA
ncbi:MAG: hypothetical protein HOV68_05375 [Streptomycetaceae bacterium]|nr:hypothetical protein [Streptomycetaceae bacterium]